MSDPRNVAHDKKVMNDKIHHGEDPGAGAAHAPQPGKKTAAAEKKHEPANHHHADQITRTRRPSTRRWKTLKIFRVGWRGIVSQPRSGVT